MLLPRFLTALVGVPVFLGALYFGGMPLLFLMTGVVWIGAREFYRLAEETGYPCYPWIGQLGAVLLALSLVLNGSSLGPTLNRLGTPALVALLLGVLFVRSLLRGPSETTLSEWAVTFFGWVFVGWTLPHFILLRDLRPLGLILSSLFVAIIWVNDTVAYLAGTRWGSHRLAPRVSPKKSWEGTLAGLAGSMAVAWMFQSLWLSEVLSPPEAVGLAAATAGAATVSDLAESLLKRGAGVKDTSTLLPGHGGLLDRFDSFVLAAPLFYYYWVMVKF